MFRKTAIALTVIVLIAVGALKYYSRTPETFKIGRRLLTPEERLVGVDTEKLEQEIRTFCGRCHPYPGPDTFPRSSWDHEVDRGFNFHKESGRTDLPVPDSYNVLAWYLVNAPPTLELHRSTEPLERAPFASTQTLPADPVLSPGTSNVQWVDLNGQRCLVKTDMFNGQVQLFLPEERKADGTWPPRIIATLRNPARVNPCDLNGDGWTDLVAADLGMEGVGDADVGRVVWLRRVPDSLEFQPFVLAQDLARVADVRAADFDRDDDVDLIVAEFGWRKTGSIMLLENVGRNPLLPDFRIRVIDKRHGAIQIPVVDLNNDGVMDFVVAVAQEYEAIDVFLGHGDGTFKKQQLFAAHTPTFGISGIQPIDIDQDGDTDILFSSGDMFDSFVVQPHHGIYLLTNDGTGNFTAKQIAPLPAAYRAQAGDIDGDGDLDIAACCFIPSESRGPQVEDHHSVVWFEQVADGDFRRHNLEADVHRHMTLELADLDGDADLDIAVGNFVDERGGRMHELQIWWNTPGQEVTATRDVAKNQRTLTVSGRIGPGSPE